MLCELTFRHFPALCEVNGFAVQVCDLPTSFLKDQDAACVIPPALCKCCAAQKLACLFDSYMLLRQLAYLKMRMTM